MNGVFVFVDVMVIMVILLFYLFWNGLVLYVKIEWKVIKLIVFVRNKFIFIWLFKIIFNNVYKFVKFKKVVYVFYDV